MRKRRGEEKLVWYSINDCVVAPRGYVSLESGGSNYTSTLCGGSFAVAGHHPMVARLHCDGPFTATSISFPKIAGAKRWTRPRTRNNRLGRGWAVNALQMTSSPLFFFLLIARRLFVRTKTCFSRAFSPHRVWSPHQRVSLTNVFATAVLNYLFYFF